MNEENNDFGKMIYEKMEAAQADTMKWLMPPIIISGLSPLQYAVKWKI